jgi:uncharacterized membrane protein YtjA (UPF0391 family)
MAGPQAENHETGGAIDTFVGRVMVRASPVLTWRPTKVQRITLDPQEPEGVTEVTEDDAPARPISVVDPPERFARISSRRMVAWPVVERVGSGRGAMLAWRAIRTASALLVAGVAGVLGFGGYAAYAVLVPARIVCPVSSKANAVHSIREGGDTLAVVPLVAAVEEIRTEPPRPEARPVRRKHARRVAWMAGR